MKENTTPDAAPTHPGANEECSVEDHAIIQSVTAEDILGSIGDQNEIIDATLQSDLQSACSTDLSQNVASLKNYVIDYESKRRKLFSTVSDQTCPRDPFIPFKRDRKRHIFKAMIMVTKYQSDILDASDFFANSKWIQYIFNPDSPGDSHYNCYFCSRYIDDENFYMRAGFRSALSRIDGELRIGENAIQRNKEIIQSHARLPTHQQVMHRFEESYIHDIKQDIMTDIQKNEPIQFKITNRHMRLVFKLCKYRLPLTTHVGLTDVMRRNELPMGNLCKGERTATNMAKAISDMYFQELKEELLESDSFVSILADGGEDNTLQHYISVLFQFMDRNKNVKVAFYKLIPLGASSTGLAYFEALRQELVADGLWDYFSARLSCIATDSAGNMVSLEKGFSNRLKTALGRPDAIVHRCMAHRLELILDAALSVCQNCKKLDKTLKAIFVFFHSSPKRSASLEKFCKIHFRGRKCYRAKRIVDVRWVSSHLAAAKELFDGWDILVLFLRSLQTDPDYADATDSNKNTKRDAASMERLLLRVDFLSSLTFQMDVQREFQLISEFLQKKNESILGAYTKKTKLIAALNKLAGGQGTFLDQLLNEAKCNQLPCNSLSSFEDDNATVEWRGLILRGVSVENLPYDCEEDRETNVIAPLTSECEKKKKRGRKPKPRQEAGQEARQEPENETGKEKEEKFDLPFQKMSSQKDAYIQLLLAKVEVKMPTTELMTTVSYLDQTQWPFDVSLCLTNMELKAQIEKWPTLFGLMYEENEMWNDFQTVITYLKENPDFWCANHYEGTTDFYSLLLKTMTRMPERFKNVLQMSLVAPASTADPERFYYFLIFPIANSFKNPIFFRSFSTMKAIKSDLRHNLGPAMLDVLMRISIHDDDLDTFDVNKATAKYLRSGHLRCDHDNDGTASNPPSTEPVNIANPPMETDLSECVSVRLEADMEVQAIEDHMDDEHLIDHRHYQQLPIIGLMEKKPAGECIAIIKRSSGKALTAFGEDIGLHTFDSRPNQLWYIHNSHVIVSNGYGKVLEKPAMIGQPVKLSLFDNGHDNQKWSIEGDINNQFFNIFADDDVQLDTLGTVIEDGTWVGLTRKKEEKAWSIEKISLDLTLIERKPTDELVEIVNLYKGNPLTVGPDGYLYVKQPDDQSQMTFKWFKRDNFIVAHNGKVIQAQFPGGPVSLEYMKADELRQQWIFHELGDRRQNYEIRSLQDNLRLDLIEDPSNSDVVKVGVLLPNPDEYYEQDTWTIEVVTGDFPSISTETAPQMIPMHERRTSNEFIKIVNMNQENPLTIGADGFLYVRPSSDQSEMALKWSNDGNFIVAHNGKVLQANDPGGPVSLEDRKSDDLRQQWIIFNLKDGHQNYEIRCLHENLRLDLIEDPSASDVFKVGALPANNGRHYDQDTWKIERISEGD